MKHRYQYRNALPPTIRLLYYDLLSYHQGISSRHRPLPFFLGQARQKPLLRLYQYLVNRLTVGYLSSPEAFSYIETSRCRTNTGKFRMVLYNSDWSDRQARGS